MSHLYYQLHKSGLIKYANNTRGDIACIDLTTYLSVDMIYFSRNTNC